MEGHCQYAVLPLKPSLLQFEKTAPFISGKCCHLAEKVGFLCCGKATAVAMCHRHIAKSRLSNPTFRENKKTVLSDGPLIWRRRWDSFSAEKPRRLQRATGTLPRAAFRIPPSNEKAALTDGLIWRRRWDSNSGLKSNCVQICLLHDISYVFCNHLYHLVYMKCAS